jgi:hypothetical protein
MFGGGRRTFGGATNECLEGGDERLEGRGKERLEGSDERLEGGDRTFGGGRITLG